MRNPAGFLSQTCCGPRMRTSCVRPLPRVGSGRSDEVFVLGEGSAAPAARTALLAPWTLGWAMRRDPGRKVSHPPRRRRAALPDEICDGRDET